MPAFLTITPYFDRDDIYAPDITQAFNEFVRKLQEDEED